MLRIASTQILDCAIEALSKSRIRELRQLVIRLEDNQVVVRGKVSSFYRKQLAQEMIRCELGDIDVVNEMQVVYWPSD
jgi:hypothetical protein